MTDDGEICPPEGKTSFSGIPESQFIVDVEAFMKGEESAESKIKALDEMHQKYKFMENSLSVRRKKLRTQVPDIKSSLVMIKKLREKKEEGETLDTQFLLSEQVYAKAKIPPTDKVCLWLGANVMLEYTLEDAEALLSKNLESAEQNLKQIGFDLDYLRDQMTNTEVTMARLYNWDVKKRKEKK
ncbi:prefoldin subunit 3 [Eurytemora carolleeae]|uniref:prefoldin subunit 3 n=1 Tax=Eurytemora carolleeae TaxID=1294199 RepID=UPI000C759A16|nr:prefoldin subunit 3 [Eurytemora carolleeae]|eukprot:XP_023348260.1 prefoldin subunit 3-like [Eurytemora affinis]